MDLNKLIEFLQLEKVRVRGDEIHASCPFYYKHISGMDRHPSFSINIEKGVYNCFSCGSKGTIEELISELKNVSIDTAVNILYSLEYSRLEALLDKNYVSEELRLVPEALLLFFDRVQEMKAEVYRGEVENKDCWIYPVRDRAGNLMGAVVRAVKEKWHGNLWGLKKSKCLLGEDTVVADKPILIVEGPGDFAAVKQSGFNNVVSIMGMAISDQQIYKLLALSQEFIVWLDKDKAGMQGIRLIISKLDRLANVRYVNPWAQLPDGCKDAKDVYEKYGSAKVLEIIRNAKSILEIILSDIA